MYTTLLTLLNLKSTDIPGNWLKLSNIYCIITVPYSKSTVLPLYRAIVPFCAPLHTLFTKLLYPTAPHYTEPLLFFSYKLTTIYKIDNKCFTEYLSQIIPYTILHIELYMRYFCVYILVISMSFSNSIKINS